MHTTKSKKDVVKKLKRYEDELSVFNLKYDSFPHIHNILKDIDPPYEIALIMEYLNAVMTERSANYWHSTPQPVTAYLSNRFNSLIKDLEGDGY